MKRPLRIAAAFALASLSAACVTVFPKSGAAPKIFRLEAPDWTFDPQPRVDWTLSIARPSAPRTLSGADLVLREGNEVVFVSGSEWAEPVPGLLQRTLTQGLDRSRKVIAATPESGVRSDCELQWDLYAFDVTQTPTGFSARFEAGVRLIEGRRRTIMDSIQIATKGEANGENARAAAEALTQAALDGLEKAGAWALTKQCVKLPRPDASTPPEAPLAGAPSAVAPVVVPVPGMTPTQPGATAPAQPR